MIGLMNLQEVQEEAGGLITGGDAVFCDVSIDTRTLKPNELFIAVKGPNFNGNDFIPTAVEKKACGIVAGMEANELVAIDIPVMTVNDTRQVLGKIGAMNRNRSKACVIALTGSQGKTSVKEMTAKILGECGEVIMTQGNLNNDLGVPLSLIKIEEQHEFAVIELGANGPNEIAYSAGLTRPKIGHITNIAGTHLEGFGDLAGVAKAKSEIWQKIEAGGTAVINLDDHFAEQFINEIHSLGKHLVSVSGNGNSSADYFADQIDLQEFQGVSFRLNSSKGAVNINLQVSGKHNVCNAMAAAAMAITAGAELAQVKAGLEKFAAVKGRMSVVPGQKNSILIDDTYNASPSSFHAAIDVLALSQGTRIVVMGDMGELGKDADLAHQEIGSYAKQKGIEVFIGVGELSKLAVSAFGEGGIGLTDRERFAETIHPLLGDAVTVLIKGSRSQGMEKLLNQIQAEKV
ncbi:MAG: UDP-N-acetylmuramoyl-tripeptide--D-alanyl-D-alanine ligase [Gammaproteobacteria bacterium]|nr:UDP-N-acetylmuramoyl-tripeptide--D-alanyl-D-alanine ligase [Gammaproteobacteria bacterium]